MLYFAARGGLLVARYARPRDSCSQNSTSIRRTVFTSAMYGICALLRLTEYLLLVKGVYTFLSVNSHFDKKEIWRILKHVWSKRDIFWLCVLLFLVPVLLLLSVACNSNCGNSDRSPILPNNTVQGPQPISFYCILCFQLW